MQKNCKNIIWILTTMILAFAIINGTKAQTQSDLQLFFEEDEFLGITMKIHATAETIPGANITIRAWINCTADNVRVDYLNLTVYGFKEGQTKVSLKMLSILANQSLLFSVPEERSYNVSVPPNVWGDTFVDVAFRYFIKTTLFDPTPSFSMTIVRNVYYEQLQEDFIQLNETLTQLQKVFLESFKMNLTTENLAQLNKSYWESQQNYTALQGSLNEMSGIRTAVIILGITTVFFVATTVYLMMRKPKEYW